ncbi:hypothetical protein J4G08_19815 [Candidatus Poribacteria bacterium]|nr:hypothetical protein [Candidatus Poribacteria bacterium]
MDTWLVQTGNYRIKKLIFMKARLPSEIKLTPTQCKTGMNWRISPFSVTLSDFRRFK